MYSLLILLILFCAAIGFGMASNNVSCLGLAVFSFLALAALQLSYLATLILDGR